MNARKTLALLGAGYLLLRLGLTAGGYDGVGELAGKLLSDQDLIAASVAVELGGLHTAAAPSARQEETVAPASTPTPAPAAAAEPEQPEEILETSITGGMTLQNETDYTVDTAALLTEGPSITLQKDQPQILIIHTHSSEAYTMDDFDRYEPSDTSRTQDANYNIIRVGDELAEGLTACGLNVIHDRGVYDYPSYTGSYTRAGEAIQRYLDQYPSIAIVIDLHRDAIGDGDVVYKTVAESETDPSSQIMFVVGSNASGLEHPNWQENLKLALYLQSAVNPQHPTLMRPVKLVKERYNQQLTTGSLIMEVGSSGNTLREALTAVDLFARSAGPALAKLIQ